MTTNFWTFRFIDHGIDPGEAEFPRLIYKTLDEAKKEALREFESLCDGDDTSGLEFKWDPIEENWWCQFDHELEIRIWEIKVNGS